MLIDPNLASKSGSVQDFLLNQLLKMLSFVKPLNTSKHLVVMLEPWILLSHLNTLNQE